MSNYRESVKALRSTETLSVVVDYLLSEFYAWLETEKLHTGEILENSTKKPDDRTAISKLYVRMWLFKMPHLSLINEKRATQFRQGLSEKILRETQNIRLQNLTTTSLRKIESSEKEKFEKLEHGVMRTTSFFSEQDFRLFLAELVKHLSDKLLFEIAMEKFPRRARKDRSNNKQ